MLELRKTFRSMTAFRDWRQENTAFVAQKPAEIVRDIRRHGLFEPFTHRYFPPREIAIDPSRLQVSVDTGGMNSRKRAGLLAVDFAVAALPETRQRKPKILGAEGVTPIAAILRNAFAFYHSTEYLPTREEQRAYFPIAHLDLTDIALPDKVFDVFFSAHVLEHVPDLRQSLTEVYRILTPGGILVSTFPFLANQPETVVRAKLKDDAVVHLLEPQYHGNPVNIGEGSLVFQEIGWDVLTTCEAVGFEAPAMVALASSRYGVVQPGTVGVMALVGRKPAAGGESPGEYPEIFYEGPSF